MKRTANAHWEGSGKEGAGQLSTQSGVLQNQQYSYVSRFESGIGTNPEELIAAAHAGCYSMKLSFNLSGAGFIPERIDTKAIVSLEAGSIHLIELETEVKAPGLTEEKFQELALDAKANCPVSKVLQTAEIRLKAVLIS